MPNPTILKRGKELTAWKKENTPEYCPICERSMHTILTKNHVVDHDHKTGKIRGVLCRNCNGLEGRINNLCIRAGKFIDSFMFLRNILTYWKKPPVSGSVYYPGTKLVDGKYVPPPKPKRRRRKR